MYAIAVNRKFDKALLLARPLNVYIGSRRVSGKMKASICRHKTPTAERCTRTTHNDRSECNVFALRYIHVQRVCRACAVTCEYAALSTREVSTNCLADICVTTVRKYLARNGSTTYERARATTITRRDVRCCMVVSLAAMLPLRKDDVSAKVIAV